MKIEITDNGLTSGEAYEGKMPGDTKADGVLVFVRNENSDSFALIPDPKAAYLAAKERKTSRGDA